MSIKQPTKVSTGGKIVMGFGAFITLGGFFLVGSPLIALVVIIMGIVAIIRGYRMKAVITTTSTKVTTMYNEKGEIKTKGVTGTDTHYNTGLGTKKDPKNKGAI